MKIGAITVGQSPRVDVTKDIFPIFGDKVDLIEMGALDGLSYEEIGKFAPEKDDYVLVSRMNSGREVTFAEKYILDRIQDCIYKLEEKEVSLIIFFCTGEFPKKFDSKVPLIFPNQILGALVPFLTRKKHINVLIPSPLQIKQAEERWGHLVDKVTVFAANPYGELVAIDQVADKLIGTESDLIVLDCIGYSQNMKDMIFNKTGVSVILPRTLAARVINEIADVN